MRLGAILIATLIVVSSIQAVAQEEAKPDTEKAQGGGDLRSAVQNPISSLISLPFKFSFDYGAPNGEASFLNIQPVVPVTVGNWNLVNRAIIPLIDSPGEVAGTPNIPNPIPGNGATGLGDINYSLYFSPVKYDKAIWGLGPSITMPSATDDQLGSDKWSAGPTGIVLFQPKWGTIGGLARHLWSFAGDSDRADVNQSLFEPFVNYNLPQGWYLIADIIITANWEADSSNRWTVPLGGGAGKLFNIGKQVMNIRSEVYYNVKKPNSAPDWQWGFTVQFLFPK
ncbi:MAG: neuromedin U [Deltaproteobacteria bacterium]|nr:neuromedin U [Deltaproteobacteria bacterium]